MIKIFELISYLNKQTKRKFIFIIIVVFINSFLEFMTIGTIVPFISFISNPNKISEIELLKSKGVNDNQIEHQIIKDGQHNEKLWSENFAAAYDWLSIVQGAICQKHAG